MNFGFIMWIMFILILVFVGGLLEFLDARQLQKFAHEQEMAKIKANISRQDDNED